MALSYSRNAKFICSYTDSTFVGDGSNPSDADTFEIGILDGFSFSQSTGTQNVTLNQAGDSPDRSQKIFNTTLEPVDWSFTSYVRPRIDESANGTDDFHGMAEKVLWNALVSDTKTNNVSTGGITSAASSCTVDFTDSNHNQLLKLTGWFVFGESGLNYRLSDMCVNSASIDFDIDGIAQITWSGYASKVDSVNAAATPSTAAAATDGYVTNPTAGDFIQNRLSTVSLVGDLDGDGTSTTYDFALTGGNITIDNGISYVTPEQLGVVNIPIDHQTGTRAISGSFTAYLDEGAKTLYENMLTDINSAAPDAVNSFVIDLKIGGATAPKVQFNLPTAHIELPTVDISDVISATINFTGLEAAAGTELNVVYTGATTV